MWLFALVFGGILMGDDVGDSKSFVTASKPTAAEPPSDPGADFIVMDFDLNVSPEWRKRLKELDDYQRAAPFVFGRLTLG